MTDIYFEGYGVWLAWDDSEANYPLTERYYAKGVFSLIQRDDIKFRHTESLSDVDTLQPSNHPDDEFQLLVASGKLDRFLTQHSDAKFYKMERSGFDDDFENALQHHKTDQANEFRQLAKSALFHIDKNDKQNILVPVKNNPSNVVKLPVTQKAPTIPPPVKKSDSTAKLNDTQAPTPISAETTNVEVSSLKPSKKTSVQINKPDSNSHSESDLLSGSSLLRLERTIGNKQKNIQALLPISRTTFLKKVKSGEFPSPVKFGNSRSVFWRTEEILELLESSVTLSNNIRKTENKTAEQKNSIPLYLDPKHIMYSLELDCAVKAWNALFKENSGKPNKNTRKLILNWLYDNDERILSKEALERIATIVNPYGKKIGEIKDTDRLNSNLHEYLDPKHLMFSAELYIVIQIWNILAERNPGKRTKGSRKKDIEQFLNEWLQQYPYITLTKESQERIIFMINPDRNGGAPSATYRTES